MKFLAIIAFALVLGSIIVNPDWIDDMRPGRPASPLFHRSLAIVMLAGLTLVIATHFHQFLQTASE